MTSMRTLQWLEQHDRRHTEKDYQRWREQHQEVLRNQAIAQIASLGTGISSDASAMLIASVTGLSASTVTRYVKKRDFGKRGPLYTTVLALRTMGRSA